MENLNTKCKIKDLSDIELVTTNGGVLPIIAVGIAFSKGFAVGASVAGTVHLAAKAIDKATS